MGCWSKNKRVVGNRPSGMIRKVELTCNLQVVFYKRAVVVASKAVDVPHHLCWLWENLEEVAKALLGLMSSLEDGSFIFLNLLDCNAVAKPKEFGAPEEFPVLTNSPTSTTSFANKRVVMVFMFGAAAGSKPDWA